MASAGFQFAVDAQDSLGLAAGHAFEADVLAALLDGLRPGQTVVDIGANIGYFTAHLARAVGPAGTVHAFEPAPANLALLRHNLALNQLDQVVVHPVALGEQPGEATLHLSDFNGGMHRLYDSVCCEGEAVSVPVQCLDDLFAPGSVALIKIDVEGYEQAVLRGARRLLSSAPRPRLVSEYCPAAMLEAGAAPAQFLQELSDWGLRPTGLQGQPVDLAELLDDARRYEAFGRERFVAACAGRSNPEIGAIVAALATQLGCRRPFIENLVFTGA